MSKLTQDLENIITYLDDLLILTNINFADYLTKLEMVLTRLSTVGMRVNATKSKFFAEQIEYLGYWITRKGIPPVYNKVEAWFCRSELLAPLTNLTSISVKFEWLPSHQLAFDKIKRLLRLRCFYHTQILINLSRYILTHLIISWVQLLCKIESPYPIDDKAIFHIPLSKIFV
jgi:Reverse transcriptase (RNA-dependent DNA polymerase)